MKKRLALHRESIALCVLVSLVFIGNAYVSRDFLLHRQLPARNERVIKHLDRFKKAKLYLPESGEIGYITDSQDEELLTNALPQEATPLLRNTSYSFETVVACRRYFLAQYALAPRVLRPSADRTYAVGNFYGQPSGRENATRKGLRELRNLGKGIVVYGTEGK